MTVSRLNPKQRRFVAEYLVDLNGTQAAIRAGYSAKTAEVIASHLLRKVKVRQQIAKAEETYLAKLDVSAARIRARLVTIGFGDVHARVPSSPLAENHGSFFKSTHAFTLTSRCW